MPEINTEMPMGFGTKNIRINPDCASKFREISVFFEELSTYGFWLKLVGLQYTKAGDLSQSPYAHFGSGSKPMARDVESVGCDSKPTVGFGSEGYGL